MKGLGILLIIVGIVCVLAGGFGLVAVSQSGADVEMLDMGIDIIDGFGGQSYMDGPEQLIFFILQYRIALLIGGVVAIAAGIVLKKRAW